MRLASRALECLRPFRHLDVLNDKFCFSNATVWEILRKLRCFPEGVVIASDRQNQNLSRQLPSMARSANQQSVTPRVSHPRLFGALSPTTIASQRRMVICLKCGRQDCGRPLFTEFNTRKGQRERRREDGQFIRPSPKIARKGSLVTAKVYTVTPPRLWVEVEGSLRASIVDLEAKNLGGGMWGMHTETPGWRFILSPILRPFFSLLHLLVRVHIHRFLAHDIFTTIDARDG